MSINYEIMKFPKNARIKNKKILKEKKGTCSICGKQTNTENHHIKSVGSGGNDKKENLIELCRVCHSLVHSGNLKI